MGKNHKHQKQLKSEKAKVKLKTKGSKQLPKGLNITDPSFKVKKIIIREQLKQQDQIEIFGHKKLNVTDLITKLQHYNSSVRQDAIRELKEILSKHAAAVLNIPLSKLFKEISALVFDKEKAIRRESLKALNLVLSSISKDQLTPFCNILVSYLACAMTHINPNVMEDSLLFLDILLQYCSDFLASNSNKIFLYFLDMISKLRSQALPGRQLTTNLNTKTTSMKWRIKVLSSLQQFLLAIVENKKNKKINILVNSSKVYHINDNNIHFPIYLSEYLQVCPINFKSSNFHNKSNYSDSETLQNYTDSLMPLMFDSWLEVRPVKQVSNNIQLPLSDEAASLLKCITSIMQSIIEYIELLEKDTESFSFKKWFKSKFQSTFIKNLFSKFPYVQQKLGFRPKKSQEQFTKNYSSDCLEQNLTLCYIYIWFTTIDGIKGNHLDKDLSFRAIQFITDKIDNWSNNQVSAVQCLIKLLRVLFKEAYEICYKNKISLENILISVINAYLHQSRKDLQFQLFIILKEIAMDHNLDLLHKENAFKEFIKSLPALLLKNSIDDDIIQMLSRVVLQYKQWVVKELEQNHDAIIENAKTIEIIGSEDIQSSRLMICNLFYCMNEQVYY